MTVKPQQALVEKHVSGLGFKMKKVGKKDCSIDMSYKEKDLRHLLCLAHYSMPLSGVFLPEGCLASIIIANAGKGP